MVSRPLLPSNKNCHLFVFFKQVYICGGFNGNECLFTAEAYDAKTNQWTLIAPMRSRRSGIGVIAYGEHVYAVRWLPVQLLDLYQTEATI